MGYSASGGPKGLGVITDSNTPLSDLTKLIELLARVGNLRVETEDDRDDITGAELYTGLCLYNLTKGTLEVWNGSGWKVLHEDTGWQTVTPSGTGFTPSGSGIRFRRINGVVYYSIRALSAGGWTGPWAMSPIPSGFEPAAQIAAVASYGSAFYEIAFNPGGNIVISANGTGGIIASGSYPRG